MSIFEKIFGSYSDRELKKIYPIVDKIEALDGVCSAMSDEELAKVLYNGDDLGYCKNLPECGDLLDTEEGIPEEKGISCIRNWLRQPVEEVQSNA